LTKIEAVLKISPPNKGQLLELSNQFYTLIPHDFGRRLPELIDKMETLKLKMKQMETLLEIQIANVLIAEANAAGIHPTDAKYAKLKNKISVIERLGSDWDNVSDWNILQQYLANTYEPADSGYTLELIDCFRIERDGESARFQQKQPHLLLWHGSRLSNWVGILSQGLRIAPPEAPKTGYMFGKGVYFGDMVAKSADYCFASPQSDVGLLLLSEVAVGSMFEVTQPHYMEQAPSGFDSCHALAKLMPDPNSTISKNGVTVPLGRGVPSNVENAFLSHGEYIVYDVTQVRMKYLLKVKFHHKEGFVPPKL